MVDLNRRFPNFEANTTIGPMQFHEWLGDSWGVLFSYPATYFPTSTTELAEAAKLHDEFANRRVKIAALSCKNVGWNLDWLTDIMHLSGLGGTSLPYPIIFDEQYDLAAMLQILDADVKDADEMPLTGNALFVIDPKKRLRQRSLYPACVGRNFGEVLRAVDALQLTDKHKRRVATPEGWQKGSQVTVRTWVPQEKYTKFFTNDVLAWAMPSRKQYMISTTLS